MEAGQLRHRVTVERPARSTSAQSGEVRLAWPPAEGATATDLWANVRPLNAREKAQQARPDHEVSHEVTMRYTTLVTPDCRIKHAGRVLHIDGIVNVEERNRELRITAREVS